MGTLSPADRGKETTATPMTRMQSLMTRESDSVFHKYQDLVVGSRNFWTLLKYEFYTLFFSGLGGALGLSLRKLIVPRLFAACGRGVTVGRNLTLRHPGRIRIGNQVVISDNCLIDGKGSKSTSIEIGDRVFIGQNSILSVHDGFIRLGNNVNIGANCAIQSSGPVVIEDNVIMAAYCHIVASSRKAERVDIPIIAQGTTGQGITVGEGTWLGSGVIVVDGVHIGKHCILGAGSVVIEDVPDYSIAVGVPARVVKKRSESV